MHTKNTATRKQIFFVPGFAGTRTSDHAYTHAVVGSRSEASAAAELEASVANLERHSAERLRRDALTDAEFIAEDLARMAADPSYAKVPAETRKFYAEDSLLQRNANKGYTQTAIDRNQKSIAKLRAAGTQTAATFSFHGSYALAAKAAETLASSAWKAAKGWRFEVRPVETK